jgi:phytoene dehydrogenase-like protein
MSYVNIFSTNYAKIQPKIVIIGAGIGGLASAAVLARAGFDVTVLEANIYPGGCAGTFFHQGYRFDAGATLAGGFYPDGPMDRLASAACDAGPHTGPLSNYITTWE